MERIVWSAKAALMQEMSKNTFFLKNKMDIVMQRAIHDGLVIHPKIERIGNTIKYYLEKPRQPITTLLFPDINANDKQQRTYRMYYSNFVCSMAEMIQKYGVV